MDGCLGDEAVGQRDADDAADETGDAEKEEIPVETCGFLERELSGLRGERADVVIVVEEQSQENSNWESRKDISGFESPKFNQPTPVSARVKGSSLWHSREICVLDPPGDVRESCPENCCNGVGVVGEELSCI